MNTSTYIFGHFRNGYNQYPDDYSTSIFNKMLESATAPTQIAIYRKGDLMYYAYIRKLEDGHTLGLCVVLNGVQLLRIDQLFSVFEYQFSGLVSRGKLVHFDKQGFIVTNVQQLYMSLEDIKEITMALTNQIQQFETCPLPPENYGIANDSFRQMSIDDGDDSIRSQAVLPGYTVVYKDNGFNTEQLTSYQSILQIANKENAALQAKNDKLQSQLNQIRNKKNSKNVGVAITISLLLGIIFISVIVCMVMFVKNDKLSENNAMLLTGIEQLKAKNESLNSNVKTLKAQNNSLESQKNSLELQNNNLKENQPLRVNSLQVGVIDYSGNVLVDFGQTIYSNNTKYLCPQISVYSYSDKSVTFYVKLYRNGGLCTGASSPAGYTTSYNAFVYSGDNTIRLNGWGGNNYGYWSSGNYRYEIWCDGMCLKQYSFNIY